MIEGKFLRFVIFFFLDLVVQFLKFFCGHLLKVIKVIAITAVI